jgi:hypothetical protein
MDIRMKTEDVQEAIREYYIRRGYARERLVDIHVKGGRKVKNNDVPNNGTVELTITDAHMSPIEDEIITPSTYNTATEDVSGLVGELDGILDDERDQVVAPGLTLVVPEGNTPAPEALEEQQLVLEFEGQDPPSTKVTVGTKFKSLFS